MGKTKLQSSAKLGQPVLLVEDDPVIGPLVRDLLKTEGYRVEWITKIKDATQAIETNRYSLVILDINLPDGNGLEFCKSIREGANSVPVLMLTSIEQEDSIVRAFTFGANDYLKKPFGKKELIARVKFQLRGKSGLITAGPLHIDVDRREAKLNGKPLTLTFSELQILVVLTKHVGEDVSREALLNEIDPEANTEVRTLDSHVSHLRKKIEASKVTGIKLLSVYKIGYRLEIQA